MKRLVQTRNTVLRDEEGNERVITEEKTIVHRTDEDGFFATFINYVKWIYNISSAVTIKTLIYIMGIAEFNTGKVKLSTGERQRLIEDVGASRVAVSRAISELVEVGMLMKTYYTNKVTGEQVEAKGEYMINPQMFWKGELKKRKELIVSFRAVYDDDTMQENIDRFDSQ